MSDQDRIYAYLEKLQQFAKEIPPNFQQRLSTELLSTLSTCLVEGQIFEIVQMLQELQNTTEKNLFQQRLNLQRKHQDEKNQFQRHYRQTISGITDQTEVLRQTNNLNQEQEDLGRRHKEELKQFDTDVILQLDQKVIDQQGTLEKAGVPGFHVTNNSTEIQSQMYLLSFIHKLRDSPL